MGQLSHDPWIPVRGQATSYLRLALLARDGELPVERIGRRFYVRVADIPAIARTLGLVSGPRGAGGGYPGAGLPPDAALTPGGRAV